MKNDILIIKNEDYIGASQMNLNDLLIYKEIYEAQSLNKAAQKMNYAQSNLTNRLKLLEQEFSAYFFIRSAKGLNPTEEGTRFYRYALSVLNQTTEIKQSFKCDSAKRKILITELLFDYLIIYQEAYIIDSYEFDVVKSNQIESLAKKKSYDLIFSYKETFPFFTTTVNSLTAVLTASPEFSTMESQQPIVFVSQDTACPFREKTLEILNDYLPDSFKIVSLDSMNSILRLVENGAGIALLPTYLSESANKNLVTWDKPIHIIPFYLHQK